MAKHSNAFHHALPPLAALIAFGLAGPAALAQSSPYYVGVSQAFTHESNIYRLSSNQPVNSDTVSTTSLLAGLDQTFGRQRLFADTSVQASRYRNNNTLNNTGYSLNGGLDWATIERLSGRISLGANRNMAQFNPGGDSPLLTKKNIQTNKQASATVRYGLVSKFTAEATLSHRRVAYSAVEYNRFQYRQNSGSLGLVYRPSGALSLGAALRYTEGRYPMARATATGFLEDTYKRHDLDLTSNWILSGASTINARLSLGKQEYASFNSRDFSGATGALTWIWQPGPRLRVKTGLSRDTGQDTSFLTFGSSNFVTSDYSRLTTALTSSATYELSAKIFIDASMRWSDRSLTNTGQAFGNDTNKGVSLGGRWLPTRNTQVGCQLSHDSRSSDNLALSVPFSANSTSCYAQIMLR
ncbi:hypothetical protein [Roseateles toxinivorans]|uniref:Beta-barrel porin 2 n=1 Tax=Roseateles toxinivorans TaxID=270368 RepID=A0A4R6QIK3_9BURK|nr:hypothetical protein [Roseateles toxinivorans]TDP63330.1 hypothetical protein DES47_105335 [Roseateles toxinivorans]